MQLPTKHPPSCLAGLYAWWAPPGMLPGVSGPAHPGLDGLELLYIGLARKSQRVRSRRIAIGS